MTGENQGNQLVQIIPLEEQITLKTLSYHCLQNQIGFPDMIFKKDGKYMITGTSGSEKLMLFNI